MSQLLTGRRYPKSSPCLPGYKDNKQHLSHGETLLREHILPACFCNARKISRESSLSEGKTRSAEFPQKASSATCKLTAIAESDHTCIARHLIQIHTCRLPLFLCERRVDRHFFQPLALFPMSGNKDFPFLLSSDY